MLYNQIVIYIYFKRDKMEKLTQLAKIFSDINRLKILALISRDTSVCVCEICDTLNLSQPLVSRHLRQMREADILQATAQGKWVIYTLKVPEEAALKCWMDALDQVSLTLPKLQVCSTK